MNKRLFLLFAFFGLLGLGGALFGWKWYSGEQSAFRGRAVPVKGLPEEMAKSWEDAFGEALKREAVLQAIVDASDYSERLEVPAGEAVAHLRKAVVVRFKNSNKTIEVGLIGKRKEDASLIKIAEVLYEEAQKEVLEIEPSFQAHLDALSEKR
jgi:hypothetical protein